MLACAVLTTIIGGGGGAYAEPLRSFHIGNSLTWDTRPTLFEGLSAANGIDHEVGFHIRSSYSLPQLWADPEPNVNGSERFADALPGQRWDVLTLQPHTVSTLGDDRQVIQDMVDLARQNPANGNLRVVLLSPWANREGRNGEKTMSDLWQEPLTEGVSDDQPMRRSRAYYDALLREVRNDLAVKGINEVHLAPTGAVFFEVAQRLANGDLQDSSITEVGDLFRDRIHASGDLGGRYLAALTHWAVVTRQDPRGIVEPVGFFDDPEKHAALTPEVRADLQQIVFDVVTADSSVTGVSVPEPTTGFGLLAAGLGWLLSGRRRVSQWRG